MDLQRDTKLSNLFFINMNKEIIYIVIPTTKERRPRLRELLDSIDENTEGMKYAVVVYENDDGGWVPAVHNAIEGINGYAVLLGSDVVVKKDWLKNLWHAFIIQFPNRDGAVQPFDEINGGALCQHPLAHSDTIKKYLDKDFIHNFSDNWMTEMLQAEGKYLYVPNAIIEHKHMVNKKAKPDETYKKVFSTYDRDRAVYIQKKKEWMGTEDQSFGDVENIFVD
jgi:GT2 family glycosyltransferase